MAEYKDCLLFATADWDNPYWTNKQHTALHLAASGHRVLYIESVGLRAPNLGCARDLARLLRRLMRGLKGIRPVEKNIWVLSPLLIPFKHHWRSVRAFNQYLLRWTIKRFMKRESFVTPLLWTYHPFMLESLPPVARGPLIYHCVDDLAAIPGIDAEAFHKEERRLLHSADVVFTTSTALRDTCAAYNANVHDFPNVVDGGHFRRAFLGLPLPGDMRPIPEPRIGYIGVLSDFKVDFPLVLAMAKQRPDWQWILIGEEREGQSSPLVAELRALPNTHFLGFKPYAELPDYLRGLNVAVLPTLLNDYTRAMFPMKYFEYLAAGVPVVSTPLDFTQHHTAGLKIGSDTAGFIRAIEQQLQRGKLSLQESSDYVGDNTWEARLAKMLSLISASPSVAKGQ